ncbi:MAG: undecaprenyl-diphosphate phosphatase [Mediterranea sp.]|jgi:undecaprenyl-diphosphatase|nr:undecaprenyl-diphosphate phosphatase [Mediterranea sp.]
MGWLEALILGLIQGFTEYLPVSSSGHLAIGAALFGLEGEENLTFAIAVHAATVLSTVVILWQEIAWIAKGTFKLRWNDETRYAVNLVVSMIPVGVVGICFKDEVAAVFGGGLLVVGWMLLATALLLTFSCYAKPRPKENISVRDAFIIGLAQACAVLPGLSRSGTTIAAGLLLGNKKESIAQFSFLMVLVPIAGEALLDLLKGGFGPAQSGIPTLSLIVGFMAAFVSGCIACRWMINLVKKGKLIYFALYCALAGILTIGLTLLQQ